MKKPFSLSLVLTIVLILGSCQKAIINDLDESREDVGSTNVTFNIKQFEQIPFDKAKSTRAQDIKDLCSKINLAVYAGSELVKSTSQKSSDSDFGKLAISLDEGTYQVVIVGNKKGNSATMTKLEQIKFSGGLSDTFFWSQEINVEDGQELSQDVDMHRNVAMVRFTTTDNMPESCSTIKISGKNGCSSSFNGYTGIGYERSTSQISTIDVTTEMKGKPATLEFYTFPKDKNGSHITLTVQGLNKDKNEVFRTEFVNVPIARNQITIYKGNLFDGNSAKQDANTSFILSTDEEWTTTEVSF